MPIKLGSTWKSGDGFVRFGGETFWRTDPPSPLLNAPHFVCFHQCTWKCFVFVLEGGSRQLLKALLEVSEIITREEMMDGKGSVSQDRNLAAKCRISWHIRTEFLELREAQDIKDDLLVVFLVKDCYQNVQCLVHWRPKLICSVFNNSVSSLRRTLCLRTQTSR